MVTVTREQVQQWNAEQALKARLRRARRLRMIEGAKDAFWFALPYVATFSAIGLLVYAITHNQHFPGWSIDV